MKVPEEYKQIPYGTYKSQLIGEFGEIWVNKLTLFKRKKQNYFDVCTYVVFQIFPQKFIEIKYTPIKL